MFLRASKRLKDGKEHHYWSIVENKRVGGGKVVQRQVLYLGEINDSQREAWRKTIEIFEDGQAHPRTVALFPAERMAPTPDEHIVRIRLDALVIHRPRQWGACWLACELYEQLGLDRFWAERLPPSRKGTRWDLVGTMSNRLVAKPPWFLIKRPLRGEDIGIAPGRRDPPHCFEKNVPYSRPNCVPMELSVPSSTTSAPSTMRMLRSTKLCATPGSRTMPLGPPAIRLRKMRFQSRAGAPSG